MIYRMIIVVFIVFFLTLSLSSEVQGMLFSENSSSIRKEAVLTGPKARNYLYQVNREIIWKWIDQNWEEIYHVHKGNLYEIGGSFLIQDSKVQMNFVPNLLLAKYARWKKSLNLRQRVDPYVVRKHVQDVSSDYPDLLRDILKDIEELKNNYTRLNQFEVMYQKDPMLQISDLGFILRQDEVHFLVMPAILQYLRVAAQVQYWSLYEPESASISFFHFHPKSRSDTDNSPSSADLASSAARGPEIVFSIIENGMDVYECFLGESKLLRSYFTL